MSFDTTRTAQKTKKLQGIHRQHSDVISVLTNISERQTDRRTDRHPGDFVNPSLFFHDKESKIKTTPTEISKRIIYMGR
jgi:hypothetical protein